MNGDTNPYEHFEPEGAHGHSADVATNNWAVTLHLMQYLNYALPPAGFVAVLLIWLLKKDEYPGLDAHGRAVTNWMISNFIYLVISGLLCMILIGIPLVILFGILGFVFPVIGAVKAAGGEVWRYPLSIKFV